MLKNSLSNFPLATTAILLLRQHIFLTCIFIFTVINSGESWQAFKISVSIILYQLMGDRKRNETYPDLFSVRNIEVLAETIVSVVIVTFIGLFLVWFIDNIGIRNTLMSREARHMRRWVREETRLLENKNQILITLSHERSVKEQTLQTVLKMEEIVRLYQHTAMKLNPKLSKEVKPSKASDTFYDLFDLTSAKIPPKPQTKSPRKNIKFKRKF